MASAAEAEEALIWYQTAQVEKSGDFKQYFQFMNGSLILADCYPEQLMTKESRIECLTDMLDEVHLLHDDFVRNQESDKIKFHENFVMFRDNTVRA